MLKAIELHCEYLKDPLGIGEKNPQFGWIIEAHGYDVVQKSYRLQVSKREDFSDVIWDTDIIESDQSCFIEYKGPELMSTTRYYFRVKITDNHNRMSEWSNISFFETGLLDQSLWIAGFISPKGADEGALSKGKLLRKEFTIDKEIVSARAYVTALGMYEVYINGTRVSEDVFTPGWTTYSKRLQYQTYDVTTMLKTGQNAVGAVFGAGSKKH